VPSGVIVPTPAPDTEETILRVGVLEVANTASIVWLLRTFVKVKRLVVAVEEPSTISDISVELAFGVMLYA